MDFVRKIRIGRTIEKLEAVRGMSPDEKEALKGQIVAAGETAIRPTLKFLGSAGARQTALQILEALLSDETLSLYTEALANPSPAVVSGVSRILRASKRYDASNLLIELSNPKIPRSVLENILLERAHDLSPRSIFARISGASRETRMQLLRLLDRAANETMVIDLLPLLDSEEVRERLMAIKMLSRFHHGEVIDGLIRLLGDENSKVRLESVQGLRQLNARAAVPALVQRLRDADLKVQSAAIDVLVELGDASTVPMLLEVLTDESEHARRGAVEVLNEIATAEAIQDLLRALHDEDWWVRVRAADALGTLGGERVVEAVTGLLYSQDEFIRRYAVEILNSVPHERAVAPLIHALRDPDWWVRERSIDALGNIGDNRAVEPLLHLLVSDPQATALCARALGKIGDARAIEPLQRLVHSDREDVRREAGRALARLTAGKPPGAGMTPRPHPALGPLGAGAGEKNTVERTAPPPRLTPDGHLRRRERPDLQTPSGVLGPPVAVQHEKPGSVHKTSSPGAGEISAMPTVGALNPGQLQPGSVLLERYRIVRKIGRGGFGNVFLVEDIAVQEELILKILNPQMSADTDELRRFIQELRLTRKITHKNVIRIFDFLDLGGAHAVSMEYFPGQDLGQILNCEGALAPERALKITAQICAGLAEAHEANVVHRDVKPANILVDANDEVKIVDFGLAWAQQRAGSRLTKSGLMIGTPEYMAPELVRGDDDVDHRADIYSLGIMMYEMLSGKRPFVAETPVKVLFLHLEGQAEPLSKLAPGISPELEGIVAMAMARNLNDRPASVSLLQNLVERELRALCTSERTARG